jgi:hypothetical protein
VRAAAVEEAGDEAQGSRRDTLALQGADEVIVTHRGKGLGDVHEQHACYLAYVPRVFNALHEEQCVNGASPRAASKLVRGEQPMSLREPGKPFRHHRFSDLPEAYLLRDGTVSAGNGVVALPRLA